MQPHRQREKPGSSNASRTSRGLPLALLCATVVITTATLAWHAWSDLNTYARMAERMERDFEVQGLRAEILRLDAALSDAATLAALTQDPAWETRYHKLEPKLTAAIARAEALCPATSLDDAHQTEDANRKLVAMERRAFELVREGRAEEAEALLASTEYREQKERYAEGLSEMARHMREGVRRRSEDVRTRTLWHLATIAVAFPLVVLAWIFCARSVWRHLVGRERAEEALRADREGLATRVAQHAANLQQTQQSLQREVHEREKIEEARRLTQFAIDHVAEAIYWLDPDGRFFAVNEAACRRSGYSREELLSLSVPDIDPNFPRESWPQQWEEFKRRGSTTFETCIVTKSGYHLPVEITATYMDYAGREFICAFVRDILSRREAEEALRASASKLAALAQEHQTLLDHTRDFLYRHDAHGMFNFVSPSVEQITGYTVDEWHKHYTTYLTDNPVNDRVVQLTEETLRTGREQAPYLVEIRHKAGHNITLEVNERPYFEEDKVAGIIGVARDVTERIKAAEEQKRAKEAAESASRAKSVFLANLSHEIRTPIMAILGAAELAAPPDGSHHNGWERRDVILRNGRHLLALVNGLLDIARLEAGKLSIQPVDCSLIEILIDVRAVVLPLHENQRVEFKIICETPLPDRIHTDPTRLKQAVINLIDNAFKFVEAGHVHVRVQVDRDKPEPRLTIAVEDTGPGIPPEAKDRIFEAFAQLEPGSTGVAKGVGLGLPLAKAIAEELGGTVELSSEPGPGTTFRLRVNTGPLDRCEWTTAPPNLGHAVPLPKGPAPPKVERLRGSILLAEDFKDTRDVLAAALEQAGASVTAVETGREAVAQATRTPFDLIILDIRMPEMDGLAAAEELRRRGCRSALIALTASADPDKHDHVLAAGFDDVWPKPISIEQLISSASAYLHSAPVDAAKPPDPTDAATDGRREQKWQARVAEFAGSLPLRVAAVRTAVQNGDLGQAGELLHQLVGAAGIHGFNDVSEQAAEALKAAREGTLTPASPPLSTLTRKAERIAGSVAAKGG